MVAIVQRVTEARVEVAGRLVGRIGGGLAALVSVQRGDSPEDVQWLARKLVELRIFRNADRSRHFDRDVRQVGGAVLLISNFTVAAATRRGRRPSFDAAADAAEGGPRFDELIAAVRAAGVEVATGEFGADMLVTLANDGPATFILNSREQEKE
jgi:D-aminoacyl-tRNA deacylase